MNMGWIKLHRTLLAHPLWQCGSPQQKVILVTLLLMANHAEKHWQWQGKPFTCKPGQMITSLRSIQKQCGRDISIKNIRTAIKNFETFGFLANKSAKQNRLLTICNWERYQFPDEPEGKEKGHSVANNRQTTGNQPATNKNVKNEKNGKKGNPSSFISFEQQELAAIRARNEAALKAFLEAPEDKLR